ncbi:beta-propeller domain-containing protein [Virgibacillus soli]|uniref:beta-propeller domain-containing protein n=2 Tax=Paracerasibacillus soli TaxID=480284 RepID=UPI0035E4DD1D
MKKHMIWIMAIPICFIVFLFIKQISVINASIESPDHYVMTTKTWEIHFSEKMDPSSLANNFAKVENEDGETVPVTFEWENNHTVLSIGAPEDGYAVGKYTLTLSSELKTIKGKPLSKEISHTFEVMDELPKVKDAKHLATLLKERTEDQDTVTMFEESNSSKMSQSESADVDTGSGADSPSETNVQVEGIDEGDKIKSDGEFIYFAREDDIIITSAAKEHSELVYTIQEDDFSPIELYIHDKILISIGYSYEVNINPNLKTKKKQESHADSFIYPPHQLFTTAYFYDISNPKEPKKVREIALEGDYQGSRIKDNELFLIVNDTPSFHISENTTKDTRPYVKDSVTNQTYNKVDFEKIYFFPESMENSYLTIGTVHLDHLKKEATIESYLGASSEMYMSKDHLYLAVQKANKQPRRKRMLETEVLPPITKTEIMQFIISDGKVVYNTSATVPGRLLNQFAMDEQKDTFRVATTVGQSWERTASKNNLYTFDLNMKQLGAIEGLAPGEEIFSVRFMEDVAYMVTFEQIDPLFVIDLQDPTKPTVLGELEIPGFSDYLHPLDQHHLIGVGQQTELIKQKGNREPLVKMAGVKISLFDVRDRANPQEKNNLIVGDGNSYSTISYNHKALYKHPEKSLFGIPVTLYKTKKVSNKHQVFEDEVFDKDGLLLLNITAKDGIIQQAFITHQTEKTIYQDWEKEISRAISVGDFLYTFSLSDIHVFDLNNMDTVHQISVPFDSSY